MLDLASINGGSSFSNSSISIPGRAHLHLGVGRCMMNRKAMFRGMKGLVIEMDQRVYESPSLNGLLRGSAMPQALPCIAAAQVLDPQPGMRGEVIAIDRTHAKVAEIASLAQDLGLSIVKPIKMDSTQAVMGWGDRAEGDHEAMVLLKPGGTLLYCTCTINPAENEANVR
eukprot:gene24138-9723_t